MKPNYNFNQRLKEDKEIDLIKEFNIITNDDNFFSKNPNLNEEKIKRAVELSVTKYCGVMEMFRKFAEVNTSSHFHNSK